MSKELDFIYMLISLLVGVFSIGQSSHILIQNFRNKIVRSYSIFITLVSIRILTWVFISYLDLFRLNIPGPLGLKLTSDIALSLTIWAFPLFVHSFFKIPFGKWINYLTFSISLILIVKNLFGHIYNWPGPDYMQRMYLYPYISLLATFYATLLIFIYYRRLKDPIMRRIGLIMGIAMVIYLPLLAKDYYLIFYDIFGYLMFTPLFYIIWNVMAFYFTIKYRKNWAKEEPLVLPKPPEEFFVTFKLSNREREIIPLIIKGHSNKEIAELSFISLSTVKSHLYSIYRKVDVKSRFQFVAKLREFEQSMDRGKS